MTSVTRNKRPRRAQPPYERLVKLFKFSQLSRKDFTKLSARRLREWQTWAYGFPRQTELGEGGGPEALTIDALREVACKTNEALRWCARGGWTAEVKGILVAAPGSLRFVGDPTSVFMFEVADLIRAEGRCVRQCARHPGCLNIFVVRRRGDFCSSKCGQLVRVRRFRDRKEIQRLVRGGATVAEAEEFLEKIRARKAAKRNENLAREAGMESEVTTTDYNARDHWSVWQHLSLAAATAIQSQGDLR